MISVPDLLAAQPQAFRDAADGWARMSGAVRGHAADLAGRVGGLDRTWTGQAADAARSRFADLGARLGGAVEQTEAIPAVLRAHADRVDAAAARLREAMATAARYPLQVAPDGSLQVSPGWAPRGIDPGPPSVDGVNRIRAQVQAQVVAALAEAEEASIATSAALRAAMPSGEAMAHAQTGLAAASTVRPPPRGASPIDVKAWWDKLDPTQKESMIFSQPGVIGRLDGIPAEVRNRCNRPLFDEAMGQLAEQRALLRAKGDALTEPERARLAELNDKLTGMEAITARLHAPPTPPGAPPVQPAYLLGFDTAGTGKAILALGNPDTAQNVFTHVPGTGAHLGSVADGITRVDRIIDAAYVADAGRSTAGVVWYGYDAPQKVANVSDPSDVAGTALDPRYALNAERPLASFQDGIQATHQGPPAHTTVISHSYGTLAVGLTARDSGVNANDLIFAGSPGVGVRHADQLGMGMAPDHVWSSTAQNDFIQHVGPPDRPGDWNDSGVDFAHPKHNLVFGPNPSLPDFGGRTIPADPGSDPFQSHSDYWNYNNPSLGFMGDVVAGHPERVPR